MTHGSQIVLVIVLGISANTDNFAVGFAYGLRRVRIGLVRNLLIAAATTVATLVLLSVGRGVRGYVPTVAPDLIAGSLLVGLGFFNGWLDRRGTGTRIAAPAPSKAAPTVISLRETFALAAALSINNIGLGFAGGVAGLAYGSVALAIAGFSVTLLWLGEWLSRKLTRPLAAFDWLRLDGNLLLVAVGIIMMLGV